MRAQLTDLTVRGLKPAEKQFKVWDTKTPGFGIIVGSTKSWFVVYGRTRQFKALGRYPDLSLADARIAAKKLLLERSGRAPALRLGEALDRYYQIHLPTMRDSSAYALKGLLERHYRSWASRNLDDLKPNEIVSYVDTLLKTPTERHKAFKELRSFLRWCVGRQYMHTNPCEALRPPQEPKARERVLSDPELLCIWRTAEGISGNFSKIVRLLILTGMRRGEVARLRGEYLDRKARTITLPGSATKNGREHTLSYGDMVADLLPPTNIRWLFPAKGKPHKPFNGFAQPKAQFDKACGVDFTLHDLRRTFATRLAKLKVAPHIIERLLNHVRGELSPVARIYNQHTYSEECRAALELWERYLSTLLNTERLAITAPA